MRFPSALDLIAEDDEPPTRRLPRRLPPAARPQRLPWGGDAQAVGADVARRCGLTRRQREPVEALARVCAELVLELGLSWRELSIDLLTGFLLEYDGGLSPARVATLMAGFDLLGDYLVCCGEIDEQRRRTWIAHAQRVIDEMDRALGSRPRRA